MKRLLVLALVLAPLSAADEIYLKSGRKVTGVVVERTATMLIVDVGPGRVGFPLSLVERVVGGDSDLGAYRERAAQLRDADAAGWVDLGHWARERGLETQARESFERALRADPTNSAAQRGLGRELYDGRWMTFAERQEARGLVEYEGQWMTPADRQARQTADAATGRARRAETRARQAEAQAEEAESRAREAESRARDAEEEQSGIPLWGWGGNGGYVCTQNCQPGCPCVTPPRPDPTPPPPKPLEKPPSAGLVGPKPHPRPSARPQGPVAPKDQGLRRRP